MCHTDDQKDHTVRGISNISSLRILSHIKVKDKQVVKYKSGILRGIKINADMEEELVFHSVNLCSPRKGYGNRLIVGEVHLSRQGPLIDIADCT